jgi:DNA-binding GntR family transcriptional regulator
LVSTLGPIEQVPLNQRVYLQLRDYVLCGAIAVGDRLDEISLARQLGVSRTPLREAIGKLVKEGLVEHRPFQGNFVRNFSLQEIQDLFEVRAALEGLAARLAVQKLPDDGLDVLKAILDEVRDALEHGDLATYATADRRFHATIAQYSQNPTLIEMLDQLSAKIQTARVLANRDHGVVQRTAHERPLILAALAARDGDEAGRLLELHIKGVADSLCSQLKHEA